MAAKEEISVEATRRSRDSGRDAFGKMIVGPPHAKIPLDFSLEAKCFEPSKGCGVAAMSRLIFGSGTGTSASSSRQPRQPRPSREIHEDHQPVVVIAGRDIAELLKENGKASPKAVQ